MEHRCSNEMQKRSSLLELEGAPKNHRWGKNHLLNFNGWTNVKSRFLIFINRYIPPQRRYCGLRRNLACAIFFVISGAVIALVLGLAVGLSRRSSHHQNLPVGSQTYSGDLTYYSPGLGACGITSSANDDIVSISHITFDAASSVSNPNANPLCKHKIRASRDGKSLDLTVVDRCVGCQANDIDVSPGAFKRLADPALGRTEVSWAWLPPTPSA